MIAERRKEELNIPMVIDDIISDTAGKMGTCCYSSIKSNDAINHLDDDGVGKILAASYKDDFLHELSLDDGDLLFKFLRELLKPDNDCGAVVAADELRGSMLEAGRGFAEETIINNMGV